MIVKVGVSQVPVGVWVKEDVLVEVPVGVLLGEDVAESVGEGVGLLDGVGTGKPWVGVRVGVVVAVGTRVGVKVIQAGAMGPEGGLKWDRQAGKQKKAGKIKMKR